VRLAATVRRRWRVDNDRSSTEVTTRGAAYRAWGTGGFARQVTAVRASAGFITGTDPLRFEVGGVSGEAVVLPGGLPLGTGGRTFPLRGAQPGELAGRRVITATLEHRMPLALVGRGLPWFLPAQLDRLSAAAWLDFATTWNQTASGPGWGPSSHAPPGAELVSDLGVGYDFPLRLRWGVARRLDVPAATAYLTVGSSF